MLPQQSGRLCIDINAADYGRELAYSSFYFLVMKKEAYGY
jgi:hypothetical protein